MTIRLFVDSFDDTAVSLRENLNRTWLEHKSGPQSACMLPYPRGTIITSIKLISGESSPSENRDEYLAKAFGKAIEDRDEPMNGEIIFMVAESPEGGYEARALGHSIFTEADTLAELKEAVADAVRCHFDEGEMPRIIRLHMVKEEVITP